MAIEKIPSFVESPPLSPPEASRLPSPVYHPDVLIFLILIPIISGINYYLTYTNIRFNAFLLLTFCLDTVQGYAAWWVVRLIIRYLDRAIPYEQSLTRRLLVQLGTTTAAGLLVIALLTELTSLAAKGKTAPIEFYSVDLVIISIWFFVINGIYVSLYYANLWRILRSGLSATPANPPAIIARIGKESLRVDPEQLSGLFIDGEYVVAVGPAGRRHYLDQSLDKLEKLLPVQDFFRVNRQYILHRKAISGFRRLDNGKLAVLVVNIEGLPEEVTMSRTRAVAFKEWFQGVAAK